MESSHKLIEDEFYKVERFRSNEDMLMKAFAYQVYFNHFRKNRNRENQTPRDILIKENKNTCQNILDIQPIIVDFYFKDIVNINQGGYFYCSPHTISYNLFLNHSSAFFRSSGVSIPMPL